MRTCTTIFVWILMGVIAQTASANDLYKVAVQSQSDAVELTEAAVVPVMRISEGYLILMERSTASALEQEGTVMQLVASDVNIDELAVCTARTLDDVTQFPAVYQEGELKLFRVDWDSKRELARQLGLIPVVKLPIRIVYRERRSFNWRSLRGGADLDSLISLVEVDSLTSYSTRLEAFYRRVSGTDSNYASADWLVGKFRDFGYDSVYQDTFTEMIYDEPKLCKNVVAVKLGTVFPGVQIVVGAHRDAVPDCPGADDNGSGTVSTLEMARVMQGIDTDVSYVFVLFDAEEQGVLGSANYAARAAARGDTIFYMQNSDMVGNIDNSDQAFLRWVDDSVYAQLWATLADSLVGITAALFYGSGGDDMPFVQIGSYASSAYEWEVSGHYHQPSDSCIYLNFEYLADMTRVSLATVYAVGADAVCPTLEFDYPDGIPQFVTPGDTTRLKLSISPTRGGDIVPGSESIFYSINSADYSQAPLVNLSGNEYTGTLPPIICDDSIRFYFSAEEATTGVYCDVDVASPHVVIPASEFQIVLEDDFETVKPWTVYSSAVRGKWERCVPLSWTYPSTPYRDFDGSSRCYVTENNAWNGDVDSGYTALISPMFNASVGDARIRYARWFYNRWADLQPQDSMTIFISSDGGFNWTLMETVGPEDEEAAGGWYSREFWISDFVAPSSMMKLKFVASDLGANTPVEAAVDAVSVVWYDCVYEEPPLCGDADGSDEVDIDDIVYVIAYIFAGGPAPDPLAVGDADCSGGIDIDDVVYLISYVFSGGSPPCDPDGNGVPDC